MQLHPVQQAIRPGVHRKAALRHREAAAHLVVNVNFGRLAGLLPFGKQRQTAVGHIEVIRADGDKQRRRIGRNIHILKRRTVDRNEEVSGSPGLVGQHGSDRDSAARGETHQADSFGVDVPLRCVLTNQPQRLLGIGYRPSAALRRAPRPLAQGWRSL